MTYEFKFSVLMPIYNVEKYLAESIDSLINQSIGFEENIELVIVDDGSPDNSKEIALKYQEKYPNNIKVFSKSNGGQASAFNFGLKHLNGKYVSFLDSDDCLSSNALFEVYDFFEKHYNEIDLVSIPLMFFERRTGEHNLNYKFVSTRVIDLVKEPYYPQLSIASSFVKSEVLKNFEFNTELIAGYDALMVNKILLMKKKIGVISSCAYHYRKRSDSTSTIDNYKQNEKFFTHSLKNLDINLIEYSKEKLGYVPLFIQYVVAYNVQWFHGISDFPESFKKDEINEFWETFYEILNHVDDRVIKDSRIIRNRIVRYFLMYLKNHQDFHIDIVENNSKIILKTEDFTINNLHNHRFYIDNSELNQGILNLLGTFTSLCDNSVLSLEAIKTTSDGTTKVFKEECKDFSTNSKVKRILGINWQFKHYFDLKIPIEKDEESKIDLYLIYDENNKKIKINNNIVFRNSPSLSGTINYFMNDSQIAFFKDNSFYVCPFSQEKANELREELISHYQKILADLEKLKKDNKDLRKENKKLKKDLKKSKNKNKEILNSLSWKITKPVRMPKQFIKKMKEQ